MLIICYVNIFFVSLLQKEADIFNFKMSKCHYQVNLKKNWVRKWISYFFIVSVWCLVKSILLIFFTSQRTFTVMKNCTQNLVTVLCVHTKQFSSECSFAMMPTAVAYCAKHDSDLIIIFPNILKLVIISNLVLSIINA